MTVSSNRYLALALGAALLGGVLCLFGLFLAPRQVLAGWWTAAVLALGFPLGAITVLMIHQLTGGKWGDAVRPPLRAMAAIMPIALLLFLPLLPALHAAYPWSDATMDTLPQSVRLKLAYLNVPFLVLRFAFCAAIWLGLCWMVLWATKPDRDDGAMAVSRRTKWSALGLILNGFAVTIFSIDWMLALEPEFTSTIYGMLEAASEVTGALALATLLFVVTHREAQEGGKAHVLITEDLGNMLFGFVLMWVYLAFMQYLIVWAGDLPEEIRWFIARGANGWQFMLWMLIALAAVLPIAALLSRSAKRSHAGIMTIAAIVLAGHFVDVAWRVRPAFHGTSLSGIWIDVGAFLAVGGLCMATFLLLQRGGNQIKGHVHG